MKKILVPFQNVKFNIWLFVVLALASVVGTLIPQVMENPDRVQEFISHSPKWGLIFQKLHFFNIYYSWWYVGLLGLLAFNVIVCKIIFGKFPGWNRFKKKEFGINFISSQSFKKDWVTTLSLQESAHQMTQVLREKRYKVERVPTGSMLNGVVTHLAEERIAFCASRQGVQRFGSWVSHISILIILMANFTGALYGFREVLNIVESGSAKMQNRSWVVACDKFTVDWYSNSSTPKTFASDLRIFEGEKLVQEKRILVNQPLEYKKIRFYQASYGPHLKEARVGFFLRKNPKKSPTVTLHLDEDVPVPGTPYSLRILQFIPDFSLDEKREVSSRSVHPKNPALQILISKNGNPLKAPWIFENFPTLQMPPVQKEDEFILVLANYVPAFYTGLQIAYDPGADLFWIGCTILVLGLMTLFYLHRRELWLLLEKGDNGEGTKVTLSGFSSRGKYFEREFLQLADDLKWISS